MYIDKPTRTRNAWVRALFSVVGGDKNFLVADGKEALNESEKVEFSHHCERKMKKHRGKGK